MTRPRNSIISRFEVSASLSNRVDIAYLFYLPFCMVFVSSDKLHKNCAPLFLRKNQSFIWGLDLKSDLKALNGRYLELPESVKSQGVMCFASTPPQDGDFLTTSLWDRHLSNIWRNRNEIQENRPPSDKKLVKKLNEFTDAPAIDLSKVDFDMQSADAMAIQRMVWKKKGSWYQIPSDIEK